MNHVCRRCFLLQAQRDGTSTARRAFSTRGPLRAGAVPHFSPTSNTELDNVLTTLRDKHFIPASLNHQQRKLIFDPKQKLELETNPITVNVGDQEIRLEPIERYKGVPERHPLILRVLGLMRTRSDWDVLPLLFKALVSAKASIRPVLFEKAIKRATAAGRFDVILTCLAQPKLTGFSFKKDAIVQQVLKSLHHVAQQDDWSFKSLDKATRYANAIAMMLEQDGHVRGRPSPVSQVSDPRTNPEVLGLYLQFVAVMAYRHRAKQDLDGHVEMYAKRTVACLEGYTAPREAESDMTFHLYNEFFARFPLWHGLTVSSKLIEPSLLDTPQAKSVLNVGTARLPAIVAMVEGRGPHAEGGFIDQIIKAWDKRIQV